MIEIDQEYVKALYMQMNEEWHERNINEILSLLPEFILQQNTLAVEQYWSRFCEQEARRLGSRARIMEQFGIEEWHHSQKPKEQAICAQIRESIERVEKVKKESRLPFSIAKVSSNLQEAIANST